MGAAAPVTVLHAGGCHCGRVRFEVTAPAEITVAECSCSICAKAGFLHLIVPKSGFRLLCKVCGIKSFYVPRSHPDGFSVNARCLDPGTVSRMDVRPFDGRNWEASARRRKW